MNGVFVVIILAEFCLIEISYLFCCPFDGVNTKVSIGTIDCVGKIVIVMY